MKIAVVEYMVKATVVTWTIRFWVKASVVEAWTNGQQHAQDLIQNYVAQHKLSVDPSLIEVVRSVINHFDPLDDQISAFEVTDQNGDGIVIYCEWL